jgi:mannosyl-3-phosphoglycerate phosphatase
MKVIIFTDLDASLLHEEAFSCLEIIDVLHSLLADGVLIIPNTSKTEVETRNILESLNLKIPFIVENGAKLCDIHCSFQFIGETDKEFGTDTSELNVRLEKLGDLSFMSDFQPITTLKPEKASEILGLTGAELEDALDRKYSSLYQYIGPKSKIPFWQENLSKVGLNLSQGGRAFAVSGCHDKSTPIKWLSEKLVSMGQRLPKIIAIGDSNNDKPMLLASSVACVIPHLNGSRLALPEHPCVIFADEPAPFGWQRGAKKALEILL